MVTTKRLISFSGKIPKLKFDCWPFPIEEGERWMVWKLTRNVTKAFRTGTLKAWESEEEKKDRKKVKCLCRVVK